MENKSKGRSKRVASTLAEMASRVPPTNKKSTSADFLAVLGDSYPWIPDNSIDLILTDPPFNIAQDTNFHTYKDNTINSYRFDEGKGWDTYDHVEFINLLSTWAGEFARVLRPGGSFAIFCADDYISHLIDALTAAGLNPRRTLTWRKPNAVPINRKTMMMSSCEYAVVGVKGAKATFNSDLDTSKPELYIDVEQVLIADKAAAVVDKYIRSSIAQIKSTEKIRVKEILEAVRLALRNSEEEVVKKIEAMYISDPDTTTYLRGCIPNDLSFNSKAGNRLHPTEKPVQLLRFLASLMSNPGDLLLDPFAGSGSTGEAAIKLGRRVIVIERDAEFFDKIETRLLGLNKIDVQCSEEPVAEGRVKDA